MWVLANLANIIIIIIIIIIIRPVIFSSNNVETEVSFSLTLSCS